MAIESGLYHSSHYDRSRPVGSYWEAIGGPEPAGVAPAAGRPGGRGGDRRRRLHRPVGRLPPGARARHPGGRARGRGGSAGVPRAAMAGSAAWAAARSAMARWRGASACRRRARFFAAQKAGRRPGPRPRRRRGDRPRARRRGRALSGPSGQPLARAGERRRAPSSACSASAGRCGARPSWRSACCARRRRMAASSCRTISGFNPLRYVRGLARAAVRRGARSMRARR